MQEIKAVCAGFGGQGVLFSGKVLTYCGLLEDRELSWLPSYGPEMRGGTANCSVTISDRPIGSPLVLTPNVLIVMNQPSYDKFIDTVEPGGIVIADSLLIPNMKPRDDVKIIAIPAQEIAEKNNLKGLGNIVMIGRLYKEIPFCKEETLEAAIRKCVPAKRAYMIDMNLVALELGRNA